MSKTRVNLGCAGMEIPNPLTGKTALVMPIVEQIIDEDILPLIRSLLVKRLGLYIAQMEIQKKDNNP